MTLTLVNEVEVAVGAARQAGDYLREKFGSVSLKDIAYKGNINIVTTFDLKAQHLILDYLKATFPDHQFLTEEEQEQPYDSCSPCRWIIDPLDGTSNYASGFPHYCISLALEVSGNIVLGVIYSPTLDEMFTAVRGGGAFLNDKRINVSSSSNLIDSIVATGFPYNNGDTLQECLRMLANITPRTRTTRALGAAALDLCYVACGRLDAYWDVELWPWDMSAGALIVEEAGGQVSDLSGKMFNHLGNNILATNRVLHSEILKILGVDE